MKASNYRTPRSGFTLIELMIVVTIVGILTAIAVPKFGELVAKSREATTKGHLGAMRSALSIYYSDMEGYYPSDGTGFGHSAHRHACPHCMTNLDALTDGQKYLEDIPDAVLPRTTFSEGHPNSDAVDVALFDVNGNLIPNDDGGWVYQWDHTNANWGTLWINCSHQDVSGRSWTVF
jgi:prepilin-type N-terminal cleavage/methylation domain-containing protein